MTQSQLVDTQKKSAGGRRGKSEKPTFYGTQNRGMVGFTPAPSLLDIISQVMPTFRRFYSLLEIESFPSNGLFTGT
jgi:hypothetical protein